MSLRDYFAAKALQGLLANPTQALPRAAYCEINDDIVRGVTDTATKIADALLASLAKETT